MTVLPEPEDDGDESNKPTEMEKSPALLTNAEQDKAIDGTYSWAAVTSSNSNSSGNAVHGVQSVNWKGAVALTDGKVWSNTYIGWGLKHKAAWSMSPPPRMAVGEQLSSERTDLPAPRAKVEEEEEAE